MVDAAFYPAGALGPDEGLGVLVPVGEEAGDGLFELRDALEAPARSSPLR
jgi:hypothetical protein